MKVSLYGKSSKNIVALVKNLGFEIVDSNPEVIISYGGDGTLLSCEREFPGIAKLPIRDSVVCSKCSNHEDKQVLQKLLKGELKAIEYQKLHTNLYGKDLYALNDFTIRNDDPTHTIRFKVSTISEYNSHFYIGDGIVVATPFGSTGYFKSITGGSFEKETNDFAVALNNTTEKAYPTYISGEDEDDKEAWFKLVRGKAILAFDNNPDIYHLLEETTLSFELSNEIAKIYMDSSLRCDNCIVKRD